MIVAKVEMLILLQMGDAIYNKWGTISDIGRWVNTSKHYVTGISAGWRSFTSSMRMTTLSA